MIAAMNGSSRYFAAVLAAGAVVLATCGDGAATKAGGEDAPVTLRIGTDDTPGRPSADQIDELARQVEALSDGGLQIEPVWQAAGTGQKDWDQAVAQLVIDGELDMGVIPARSWDVLGVDSLRGLHAPFLVTSDELIDAVVADDELAAAMLDGLDTVGITGLALLPEGLRHVFSFGDPLVRPDDFDGGIIRAPTSDTTYAVWEAFGATVDDFGGPAGDRFGEGVADGSVIAAESAYVWAATLPGPTTATANATPFPKVNVIVANTDVFDGLSDEHQQVLRDAAVATRDWAIATNRDDGDYAAEYCANGGTIVLASDDDVAALRAAAQVVYDDLEQDDATAQIIGRIGELAATVEPPEPIEPCGSVDEPDSSQPSATSDGQFPEGVYRTEMTVDELRARGLDPGLAQGHAGVNTLTIADGEWRHSILGREDDDCVGTYLVEADRIRLIITPSCGGTPDGLTLFEAAWSLDGDELQFLDVTSAIPDDMFVVHTWGGQPWTRLADAEGSDLDLDGVYRFEVTYEYLVDAGIGEADAHDEAAIHTVTVDAGRYTEEWGSHFCTATYSIAGNTITVRWKTGCHGDFTMTATVDSDVIRWSDVRALPPFDGAEDQFFVETLYAVPWVRLGDVGEAETAPEAAFPEGVYRMEITAEQLTEAGVSQIDAFGHAGTWTLTFDDGRLTVGDVIASSGAVHEDSGIYCVEDGRVSLGLIGEPQECGDFWSAVWTFDGDELRFTEVRSGHGSDLLIETLFGSLPFSKID